MGDVIAGEVELTKLGSRHVTRVDAADCWKVELFESDDRDLTELTWQVLNSPGGLVRLLLRLRDFAAAPFGLKTSDSMKAEKKFRFPLLDESHDELILGVDDKHLDFWISSRLLKNDGPERGDRFQVTTYVRVNNKLGRLYWGVVQYVHPLVVKAGMRRL